jgi:hypothetical protein
MHYLRDQFHSEWAVWLMIGIIALSISEGLMAATITPQGEEYLNPVVRLFAHVTITLMSVIVMMQLPPMLWRLLDLKQKRKLAEDSSTKITEKQKKWVLFQLTTLRLFYLLVVIPILIIAAFGLPYLNLLIIAVGLDVVDYMSYAFYETFTFYDLTPIYEEILRNENLEGEALEKALFNFSIFRIGRLGMTGMASFVVYITHIGLTIVESTITTADFQTNQVDAALGLIKKKDMTSKAGKYFSSKEEKKEAMEDGKELQENFRRLVFFFRPNGTKSDWREKVEDAIDSYLSLSEDNQVKMSNKMANTINLMDELNAQRKDLKKDEKDSMVAEIRKEIMSMFNVTKKMGGLEVPLFRKDDDNE